MCSASTPGSGSLCFTLLVLTLTIPGIIGGVQVSIPPVVEAEIGKPISIPCVPEISTPSTMKYVQWFVMEKNTRQRIYFQDEENRIINNNTDYTDRINVDKSYTLTIDNVELQDERTFCCQVGAGPAGNGEATTELKVYGAPERPEIRPSNNLISVMKTEPSKIATCQTRNGYPAPNITWYKDRTPLQATTKINNKMYMISQATKEPSGLYTIASTLYYMPEKKDKDSKFFCEVNYRMPPGLDKMESNRIKIQISYPTENVEFQHLPKVLKETDNVTLMCNSDGSSSVEYTFYRVQGGQEEEILASGTDNTFELVGVKRNESGVYGCRVLDFDADDTDFDANKTITINYLDPIALKPKGPYIFKEGDKNKSIYCSAEGSQQTSVIWKKHKKIVGSANLLQLPVVTSDDSGNYTCEVTIRDVTNLHRKKSIRVTVEGPPKVNCTEKILHKGQHYVNLTCTFKGYPTPNITCSFGKEVQAIRKRQLTNHIVISELILPLPAEALNVTCTGSNKHGSKTHNSILHRESLAISTKGPPIAESMAVSTKGPPIAGKTQRGSSGGMLIVIIIVCIILLAFLGAVLYFLYKKGKIPCGRSGKQDITRTDAHDDVVVEVKNDQKAPEETVLLQGVNGEKKLPTDQ